MTQPDSDLDLTAALRDRVRDEHPDLHHLTAVSLREGTRIKRRRTAGVAAGVGVGLTLVAGTVLMAAGLPGGDGEPTAELAPAVGAAADPAPETAPEQECVPAPEGKLPSGVGPEVKEDDPNIEFLTDLETKPLCDDRVEGERGENDRVVPPEALAPLQEAPPLPDADQPAGAPGDAGGSWDSDVLPFTLEVDGWTCEPPAIGKVACTSGTAAVTIIVRPATQLDAWTSDADKEALWVSPVRDGFFVTVQGAGFGQTDPQEFIDGLTFK